MTRGARPLRLDFVAPVHRAPFAGGALLAAGLAAALGAGLAFARVAAERTALEAAVAAAAPAPAHRGTPAPEAKARAAEAAAVERELSVPWTRLLAALEAASHDRGASVALLHVEPDPGKRRVRITAEVRALDDALAYLRRLQGSDVLRHPTLESHERRRDDPEHPLRIELSAEWGT